MVVRVAVGQLLMRRVLIGEEAGGHVQRARPSGTPSRYASGAGVSTKVARRGAEVGICSSENVKRLSRKPVESRRFIRTVVAFTAGVPK
jgi:hypothetical protein